MNWKSVCFILTLCLVSASAHKGPHRGWMNRFRKELETINAGNCDASETVIGSMSGKRFQVMKSAFTGFQGMRLAVLNRAFFFSYILQSLNTTAEFSSQPDLDYYILSSATTVSSVQGAAASGIYFDKNTMYPNFDWKVPFNQTYPLFAPRAIKDTVSEEVSIVDLADYGNYTSEAEEDFNPWFHVYLPDADGKGKWKASYDVDFTHSDGEFMRPSWTETKTFTGPPRGRPDPAPVRLAKPYFDCGRTNKWLITAFSPIIDATPRYCGYTFLMKPRIVAIATIDFDLMDMMIQALDTEWHTTKLTISSDIEPAVQKDIMNNLLTTGADNCQQMPKANLTYPEKTLFAKATVFEHQLHGAERLANFISGALATRPVDENDVTEAMKINKKLMYGEVLAAVMADPRVASFGVYFDHNRWQDGDGHMIEYFAPRAWRERVMDQDKLKVKDMAMDFLQADYTKEEFFVQASLLILDEERYPLERMYVHESSDGSSLSGYGSVDTDSVTSSILPRGLEFTTIGRDLGYKGYRSGLTFDCDGLGKWLWTYSVPFFEKDEFAGVVTAKFIMNPHEDLEGPLST